jgi:NadR type nicotinamide-nucleotide adenylyltransferase
LKRKSKIIVVTGAESTGKTTLTKSLASHFKAPFIPEIAREYVEKLDRNYNYHDVENIAKLQVEQLNQLLKRGHPLIFIDTWLFVTKVWFEEVFGKTPEWLFKVIQNTEVQLFLVCNIDIPWVHDPVRENGGEMRKILHKKYINNIKRFGFEYEIVSGTNELRFQNALKIIQLLKEIVNK